MKKNPLGQFLSQIPKSAKVLSAKGFRRENKEEIKISYLYGGEVYNYSVVKEGGMV